MDNKILLSFPKLENNNEVKTISDVIYILQANGFEPTTVNTALQPNNYDVPKYEPPLFNEAQLLLIKQTLVAFDEAGLVIRGEIGLPKPRS